MQTDRAGAWGAHVVSVFAKLKGLFQSKPKDGLPIIDVAKRFELIGRVGQGSMSKVWRARDRKLGRMVCLKVLDRVKTDKFESRFPGLKRPSEGLITQSLRHPNIVQTFEHGLTREKEQYIVMELIDGMGLNFWIETKNPHLEGKRLDLLRQIAKGLGHVHKHGYLHRDICPRNIMINQENVVKIIDFGLTIPYKPEFCKPGNRTGTPSYLAPELIKRQTTDHRVDMFALGVTAYEMFTGAMPWEKAESLQTLLSHMNHAGKDPREHRPDLDPAIAEFLIRGIERSRERRFQSPDQFMEAIDSLPPC